MWLQTSLSSKTPPNILRKRTISIAVVRTPIYIRIILNTDHYALRVHHSIFFYKRGKKIETPKMSNKRAMVKWIIVCCGMENNAATVYHVARLCSYLGKHLCYDVTWKGKVKSMYTIWAQETRKHSCVIALACTYPLPVGKWRRRSPWLQEWEPLPPRTFHPQNFLCQLALWGKDFNTLIFPVLLEFSGLFFLITYVWLPK